MRVLLAVWLLMAVLPVRAHDSWLAHASSEADTRLLRLQLATGSRFPLRESAPSASSIAQAGCRSAATSGQVPLTPRQQHARYLELRARADASGGAACWVELKAQDVEMTPELVATYFSEIRPQAQAVERWKQQQAGGIGWRESYRKSIRIEVPPAGDAPVPPDLRRPQGLGMEIVPVGGESIRAGQPFTYQLLRDGAPLAKQWLEFVNERHTLGVWRQTDAQGQVRQALPFGGGWLLRATRVEPPEQDASPWRSRFATLLVHVR
ncbi:DUF4198 domain-containing protein [Ramlibacter henchirensis]|uniref:DUF4198 domain-containing protein n=1 Tax=Ramlibacter henchirensis TaxID=204072 RepID=A0A4Z0BRD8_9BURK|nr:DUF4198 domain-containing protein [Ramlibacter henchirensis]TFZ00970.1 DUF4198 domain-containing protein [Ramlibacter henchirensis]